MEKTPDREKQKAHFKLLSEMLTQSKKKKKLRKVTDIFFSVFIFYFFTITKAGLPAPSLIKIHILIVLSDGQLRIKSTVKCRCNV